MTKFKTAIVIILAAILVAINVSGVICVFADTTDDVQNNTQEVIDPDISSNESGLEGLAEKFTAYLKDKYGADYEYYYNRIIEQWGSVEGYLLSFGNKLPEEYQSGWDRFVGWLGDYAPVWAVPLAIMFVIIVAVVGKKTFNKIVEKVVNAKVNPIVDELNKQSAALITIMHAQKALLPKNEQFTNTSSELEESERGLKGE